MKELFVQVKKVCRKEDLIQFSEESYNEILELYNKIQDVKITELFKDMKSRLLQYELNISDFYYTGDYFSPFLFKKGFCYHSTFAFHLIVSKDFNDKNFMLNMINGPKYFEKLKNDKEFITMFMMTENKFQVMLFNEIYYLIPEKSRYEIFAFVYTNNDYGLRGFDNNTIIELLQDNKNNKNVNRIKRIDKNGNVVVYRGAENLSTPIEEIFSWTLDKKTAEFFANRFQTGTGILYKAKVRKENIIDYFYENGEKEVLILPENIEDLEVVKRY